MESPYVGSCRQDGAGVYVVMSLTLNAGHGVR